MLIVKGLGGILSRLVVSLNQRHGGKGLGHLGDRSSISLCRPANISAKCPVAGNLNRVRMLGIVLGLSGDQAINVFPRERSDGHLSQLERLLYGNVVKRHDNRVLANFLLSFRQAETQRAAPPQGRTACHPP